jgi:hypothetical protein
MVTTNRAKIRTILRDHKILLPKMAEIYLRLLVSSKTLAGGGQKIETIGDRFLVIFISGVSLGCLKITCQDKCFLC